MSGQVGHVRDVHPENVVRSSEKEISKPTGVLVRQGSYFRLYRPMVICWAARDRFGPTSRYHVAREHPLSPETSTRLTAF
jgi:hypothetical protein